MNWMNWLFWGAVATLAQTLFEAATHGMRLTRISLPFMIGTMFTADRSKAQLAGFAMHIVNGLAFTLVYMAAFHFIGASNWWCGAIFGFVQGVFVLVVGVTLIPEMHPRMATARTGPTATRMLEPPGFLALNYGPQTPISILMSHMVFGTILGSFCHA